MASVFLESQESKLWLSTPQSKVTVNVVTDAAKKLMADKIARQKERGIKIETLRTMIIWLISVGQLYEPPWLGKDCSCRQ